MTTLSTTLVEQLPDTAPLRVARARPDLRRLLLKTLAVLGRADSYDARLVERFLTIGWLEYRRGRIRLSDAGNLVYALEARTLRAEQREARRAGRTETQRVA